MIDFFLIPEAGMFQCNLSRIYSNICQLFKVEKKNAIGLPRISQHTKHNNFVLLIGGWGGFASLRFQLAPPQR